MNIHFRFSMLILVALGFTSELAHAQTSSADSTVLNPIARKVQRFYNQNQVDSLYAMVDDSFRKAISPDTMKTETNGMRSAWGKWTSMKFEQINNGVAHYTATFDKATNNFYLGLAKDGKVETLLFRPKQK